MNPLEMMMQMVQGGPEGSSRGQKRGFLEGGRLKPGRVSGVPQVDLEMGQQPEGGGLDPELIRMLMMGGQA